MTAFPILDWHLNTRVQDAEAHLGRIPLLFNPDCADPAWLQLQDNYPDGFRPEQKDFGLTADEYLTYPGLPACPPSAMATLREERLLVYAGGWLAIVRPNGEFTVAKVQP